MTTSNLHWQTIAGEWLFKENDAQQTASVGSAAAYTHVPMDDFMFSTRITPAANEEPQAGVIFRSDASGANRYGFRARQRGLFLLEKFVNGGRTEIAGRIPVPVDDAYTLTVIVTGWRLRCFVDGRKVYDLADPAPLMGHHLGLLTLNTTARFEDIDAEPVTAEDLATPLKTLAKEGVARREREYGFRCHVIDLKGRSGFLSVGDLDGDGVPDFVATQGTKSLTAVTQRGEVLWAYDNPNGAIRAHPECQMPTTVYDIDGDGANEVICRWYCDGQEFLYILDGSNGAVKRELQWEHAMWPDPGEDEVGHLLIANLRGLERPQDIIVTTAHHGIFAFTDELKPLWGHGREKFEEEGLPWLCHHPYPEDLDGDGCDEVACGGMLLDHDGKVLWTKDLWAEVGDSHTDSVMIGDVDGDPTNGKEIAYSGGACLLNAQGDFLWKQRGLVLHGQSVRLGKARANVPGLQMLVLDITSRSPGTYLFSAKGEVLLKLPPGNPDFLDWDGDGLDEIACHTTLYGASGRVLAELPVEEVHTAHGYEYPKTSYSHFIVADVTGDARQEVIWASGDLIVIFENTAKKRHPPLKFSAAEQQARWKKIYNTTRY
jgi:hypothetical protein